MLRHVPLTHAHAFCLTLTVSPAMLAGRICVGFRNADALCTLPGMRMRERLLSFPSRAPHGGSCSASTRLYVSDDRTSAFRAYRRICKRGVHSGRLLLAKCALSWPAETCMGTVGGLVRSVRSLCVKSGHICIKIGWRAIRLNL